MQVCLVLVAITHQQMDILALNVCSICMMTLRYSMRGANKSLARLTSPCHRTESIVSLERGACSCAELQVFSCYRG